VGFEKKSCEENDPAGLIVIRSAERARRDLWVLAEILISTNFCGA